MDIHELLDDVNVVDHYKKLHNIATTIRTMIAGLEADDENFMANLNGVRGAIDEMRGMIPMLAEEATAYGQKYFQFVLDVFYNETGLPADADLEKIKQIYDIVDHTEDMFDIFGFMKELINFEHVWDLSKLDPEMFVDTNRAHYTVYGILGGVVLPFRSAVTADGGDASYAGRAFGVMAKAAEVTRTEIVSLANALHEIVNDPEFSGSALSDPDSFSLSKGKADTHLDSIMEFANDVANLFDMMSKMILPMSHSTEVFQKASKIYIDRTAYHF